MATNLLGNQTAPPPPPPPPQDGGSGTPPATPATPGHAFPFTSATNLTVEHNLGRPVMAQVFDTAGRLVWPYIRAVNLNTLNIIFSTQLSGTVVVS